jgi:hypothetical protein
MEGGRTRSERRKRNLDDMPIEKGEGKKTELCPKCPDCF